MPTVTESVELPADAVPLRTIAQIQLYQADRTPLGEARNSVTDETVVGRRIVVLDGTTAESPAAGTWSLDLPGNADLVPAGTVWGRRLIGPQLDTTLSYATVATTGGPYQWQEILTDPPAAIDPSGLAAHAADDSLHGGGQEIAIAQIATNFTTTSTTYVDVTGATITFEVPGRPFVLEAWLPLLIEEANRVGDIRMVFGATPTVITADSVRSAAASQAMSFHLRARIPASTWTPLVGSTQTVKLQAKTSAVTSDLSVFVDFAGPVNIAYLQAYTV